MWKTLNFFNHLSGLLGAELLGEYLKEINWDLCYSSDLFRAINTANILLSKASDPSKNKNLEQTPLIREKNFGVKENLPKDISVLEATKIVAQKLGIDVSEVIDTTESPDHIFLRQKKFLSILSESLRFEVESGLNENKLTEHNILCVTHGHFIQRFFSNLQNDNYNLGELKSQQIGKIPKFDNCSISLLHLKWRDLNHFISSCNSPDIFIDSNVFNYTGYLVQE